MPRTCLVNRDGDGDSGRVIHQKILTARKTHRCCECRGSIAPGEQYENFVGSFDGQCYHAKTCSVCLEIRDRFCCGWIFEEVLEDVAYAIRDRDGDLDLGCLDGLSPAAVDRIAGILEDVWKSMESSES